MDENISTGRLDRFLLGRFRGHLDPLPAFGFHAQPGVAIQFALVSKQVIVIIPAGVGAIKAVAIKRRTPKWIIEVIEMSALQRLLAGQVAAFRQRLLTFLRGLLLGMLPGPITVSGTAGQQQQQGCSG